MRRPGRVASYLLLYNKFEYRLFYLFIVYYYLIVCLLYCTRWIISISISYGFPSLFGSISVQLSRNELISIRSEHCTRYDFSKRR